MNPTIDLTVELRHAVDELTLPSFTKVNQDIDGVERVTRVEHAPLLTQLEEAIASTIGGGSGRSMTAKWALSVLDSDALYQFSRINSTILDWCRMAGLTRPRHPVDGLRTWHAWALGQDIETGFYVSQLRGWAATIRGKLEPRRSLDLPDPCPACHATTWATEDGDAGMRPLVVTYQPDSIDLLATAKVTCRACGGEWRGIHEVREIAYDLETMNTQSTDEEQGNG